MVSVQNCLSSRHARFRQRSMDHHTSKPVREAEPPAKRSGADGLDCDFHAHDQTRNRKNKQAPTLSKTAPRREKKRRVIFAR